MADFLAALRTIEADLKAGNYRPGTWEKLLRALRRQPRADRLALSDDVSRVSRKLHARGGVPPMPISTALLIEVTATALAALLLIFGLRAGSNLATLAAAAVWITTFQPLVKMMVGSLLGIRYDYAYLRGVEPRFKMRYGTYLAAPRWQRIVVHLSGMLGSPLAAWLVSRVARPTMPIAGAICTATFWIIVLANAVLLLSAFAGRRRIGSLRLAITGGGVAGAELREALLDR